MGNTNRSHDNISFQKVFIDLNFTTVIDVPVISSLEMCILNTDLYLYRLLKRQEMISFNFQLPKVTFGAAMNSLERWQHVFTLLRAMRVRRRSNVVVQSAGIKVCEKAEKWKKSLELLEEVTTMKASVNLITYNATISSCVKGTRWEAASFLHSKLEDFSLQATTVTYTTAMQAGMKGHLWQEAMHFFAQSAIDVMMVSVATEALVNQLQWSEVLELMRSFQRSAGRDKNAMLLLYDAGQNIVRDFLRHFLW